MLTAILTVLIFIAIYAFSWLITCGIIYLITLCFGLAFSWLMATGVWLIMILLKSIFSSSKK